MTLKRTYRLLLGTLLFALFVSPVLAQTQEDRALQFSSLEPIVQEEGSLPVIVIFSESSGKRGDVYQRLSRISKSPVQSYTNFPLAAMEVDDAGLQALHDDPDIAGIQEDQAVPPHLEESTVLIGANAAWSSGYTGAGQSVAILDTGFDLNHRFIENKIIAEACFSKNVTGTSTSLCPNSADSQTGVGSSAACDPDTIGSGCRHGTGVAGVAAGNNGPIGIDGVAPDAGIIAINVFSDHGNGNVLAWSSDYIAGLDHVYSLRNTYTIAAANLSLGGGKFNSESTCNSSNAAVKVAADQLATAGIAVIASSGNDGYTGFVGAPSCVSSIISVGSTTKSDVISSFSNHANIVDLLAPGSSITTSWTFDDGFAPVNGTSFSAPTVTGAWAVIRESSPSATIDQILAALQNTGATITGRPGVGAIPRIQVDEAIGELACGYTWKLDMTVRDASKKLKSIGIGQSVLNTDDLDTDCNESKAPPNPPLSALGAVFEFPDGETLGTHDYRSSAVDTAQWTLQISGKNPFTIHWDPNDLPEGFFWLRDNVNGAITNVNMKSATFYRLVNKSVKELTIERYEAGSCSALSVTRGWNMVSIPLDPLDGRKGALFKNTKLVIYGFNGSYTLPSHLAAGKGYWVYFPKGATYTICGHAPGTTVNITTGWNLIAGYDVNMAVGDATTTPGALLSTDFFSYTTSYAAVDSVMAGRAYWVKSSGNGVLNVPSSGKRLLDQRPRDGEHLLSINERPADSTWARLHFEDESGQVQTLFVSNTLLSEEDRYQYLLPPLPPGPVFDARFLSGLQVTDAADTLVLVAPTPVTVSAPDDHPMQLTLFNLADNKPLVLSGARQYTLPAGRSVLTLKTTARSVATDDPSVLPTQLDLSQNYPNPFSQRTTVRFALPSAGPVTVTLYNVLGQAVQSLVDASYAAGNHAVEVDGSALPAGAYFYVLESESGRKVRMLTLVQ